MYEFRILLTVKIPTGHNKIEDYGSPRVLRLHTEATMKKIWRICIGMNENSTLHNRKKLRFVNKNLRINEKPRDYSYKWWKKLNYGFSRVPWITRLSLVRKMISKNSHSMKRSMVTLQIRASFSNNAGSWLNCKLKLCSPNSHPPINTRIRISKMQTKKDEGKH